MVYRRNPKSLSFKHELLNLSCFLCNDRPSKKKHEEIKQFYIPNSEEDLTLVFESRFESGNLWMAFKVSEQEYDLVLQNDVNTRGHTQWFYFRVLNTRKDLNVKFNIINLCKSGSLYNSGMKVLIRSEKCGGDWFRGGEDISYYANGIARGKKGKTYYTMTFKYNFPHNNDTVFFAYSYPYTFTNMMEYLQNLEEDLVRKNIIMRKLLTYSIGGNRCDYLTITAASSPEEVKKRRGVVISARVHPGETVGSWMMHGVLEFLTGNTPEASLLRENFVFKIIPMLNPDGVINGNYRCNLAGVDLNRRWKDPLKSLHPTICATKKLIKAFARERPVELICDLHGHSRKHNIFMYGCNIDDTPEITRCYPYILSKISKFFSYKYCSFIMQKSKDSTMRIAMFKETRVPHIYTLEATFAGCNFGPFQGVHLTTENLMTMGKELCQAIVISNNLSIDSQVPQVISMKEALDDIKTIPELLETSSEDGSSSGSDSDPSEDNLNSQEMVKLLVAPSKRKKITDRPITKKDILSISFNKREKEKEKFKQRTIKKCTNCGDIEDQGHLCMRQKLSPKDFLKTNIKPIRNREYSNKRSSTYNATVGFFPGLNPVHVNSDGKKVRDQSTQTQFVTTPRKPESVGASLYFLDVNETSSKFLMSEMLEKKPEIESMTDSEKERGRITNLEKHSLPFIAKGKTLSIEKHLKLDALK